MQIINSLLKSNNWAKGRQGPYPVDTIVVHVMEGSEEAANNWFENNISNVSSHYGIHLDGTIEQYVKEEDTAWCNGRIDRPTAQIILERPNANPNSYTISIEHEGSGKTPMPAKQKAASVWLIKDIARRRKIPLTRRHVIGHREIFAAKSCPGVISVTELVQLASAQPVTQNIAPVVWSDFFKDYLVITKYVSDTEWYFVPLKTLTSGTRASAKFSQMKLHP